MQVQGGEWVAGEEAKTRVWAWSSVIRVAERVWTVVVEVLLWASRVAERVWEVAVVVVAIVPSAVVALARRALQAAARASWEHLQDLGVWAMQAMQATRVWAP